MCEVLDYYNKIGVEQGLKEGIAQGIEQGIGQGIQQGIQEEQINRIRDMLLRGKTPEQIHDFCGYSLDLIHNVATGKILV